jgi:hypothetical protein
MSMRAIYVFPGSVWLFRSSQVGRLILGIYKSLTDTCRNWEQGRTVSFLGTHKLDILYNLALLFICNVLSLPSQHPLSLLCIQYNGERKAKANFNGEA